MRIDMLKVVGNVVQAKQTLWEHRYELNRSPNPEVKLRASQAVEWTSRNLKNVKTYLEQRLSVVTTRIGEESARLGTGLAPVEEELLSKRKAAYLEQAEALQRLQSAIGAVQVLADRTRLEIGETQRSQTWPERVADVWAQIASYAKSAWHLELMAVEDTIEVDGQKVTGTRSVTVGKVVRALLLFAIGYYASVLVGRLGERVGIGYFGMDAGAARLLRSWLQVIGLTVLFVLVLVWVKIPLTIFAFLGGAVAIGIGFGTQTLFKNLISGLMVLGERPFRLGDIVDVGGMRGTITNIGVRSSTIRDGNGIETLVPNSTFLEQNLTNWTYSSRQVRFVVRVGVAYGSPVQRVRELLAECADRHGLVLDDPPAEVLFEDFGADALLFALHYWVDLKPSTNSPQIASDLRYMIAKAFATEGIAIAFPQRDVHLDTAAPLRVEIVREAGREGEKPAGGVEPVKLRDTAS
jgi:potassium-dependent mechanosensitive channel